MYIKLVSKEKKSLKLNFANKIRHTRNYNNISNIMINSLIYT